MTKTTVSRSCASAMLLGLCAALAGCASSANRADPATPAVAETAAAPAPGTIAYDKSVWFELLGNHTKIRREVRHIDRGVEAVTESDDPEIAAKIIDHTLAMQDRVKFGAQVRVWDPVFAELFKNHEKITLIVTPTEHGVTIVETSDDPHVVELLRAHAAGVSDFVREGFQASQRETPMPKPPAS